MEEKNFLETIQEMIDNADGIVFMANEQIKVFEEALQKKQKCVITIANLEYWKGYKDCAHNLYCQLLDSRDKKIQDVVDIIVDSSLESF